MASSTSPDGETTAIAGTSAGASAPPRGRRRLGRLLLAYAAIEVVLWGLVPAVRPLVGADSGWIGAGHYPFSRYRSEAERALSYYDGAYYLEIADKGYERVAQLQGTARPYAFFPLYPLLVRALRAVTLGRVPLFALALAVNLFATVASIALLEALYRRDAEASAAVRGVVFFLVFPAIPFYTALYAEPAFLVLALCAILLARDRRWWGAGAVGALAAATRPQGILLAAPLVVECVQANRLERGAGDRGWARVALDLAPIGLLAAGLLAVALFDWSGTGDPWRFVEVERLWGRSTPSAGGLLAVFSHQLPSFFALPLHDYAASKLDLAAAVAFVGLLPWIARDQRASSLAYAVVLLALPLSTGRTISMLRALSLSYPHFLEVALLTRRRPAVAAAVGAASFSLAVFVQLRLLAWGWAG